MLKLSRRVVDRFGPRREGEEFAGLRVGGKGSLSKGVVCGGTSRLACSIAKLAVVSWECSQVGVPVWRRCPRLCTRRGIPNVRISEKRCSTFVSVLELV